MDPEAIRLTDPYPDLDRMGRTRRGSEDDAFFDSVLEEAELNLLRIGSVDRENGQGVQYQGVQGLRPRLW
jgi:hypothetical protein